MDFGYPNFLYIFNGTAISNQKVSCRQKIADQFLILVSRTAWRCMILESNEQLNAESSDHIIYRLIERMAIIDHPDSNQSIIS